MAKRKTTHIETFAAAYKRLEEVMLANSGENEFEEIFKIILIKLWEGLHNTNNIHTLDKANGLLTIIDANWPGVLIDTKLKILDEQFSVCIDIIKNFSFTEDGYEGIDSIFEYIISREKKGPKDNFLPPDTWLTFVLIY